MNKKAIRKRLLAALTALLLLLPAGCGAEREADARLSVVCTIFPQYDFIRAIAGDEVELRMLLRPGAEAHAYEPSPQDIIAIQEADLFIYVGGESDEWVETILSSMPSGSRRDVALMDLVELAEEAPVEEAEHGQEEEVEYDEHVWTSPVNVMAIVTALADALCELDPGREDAYRANAEAYLDSLRALDAAFREVVSTAARREVIFGDRFPLTYFVREYGLDYRAAFPGCASETEPSAATIARLIQDIMEDGVPVVFYIELSNHLIADALAEQTGAREMLFYTCHNVTLDDFEAGRTYLDMMRENVEALRTALN